MDHNLDQQLRVNLSPLIVWKQVAKKSLVTQIGLISKRLDQQQVINLK